MSALFDTRYYSVTKLFASIVGIWPYQSQLRKKIIQSVSMFVMFTFFPPQVKRLYDVWGKDIDAMCMCLPPIVVILVSMAKVLTSVRFDSEVKELLCQIETDWKRNPTAEEYKILVNYTSKARTLCIIYSTMLCNGLMCFIMAPLISPVLDIVLPHNETRERSLVYDLDYGIDLQTHWLWLWLHSSTTSTATILNIIGADLMYVTLTVHSCCLFAIVRHKLEHVADSIKKHAVQSFENHNYNNKCYVKYEDRQKLKEQAAIVRDCVIKHQRAIHCVQLLCCIYTWCFLAILGLNLIIISISAVQLVSKMSQWDGMATCIVFICGQLIHLFFLSLMAQYLLDQSSNVHESTYSCFWYNMPIQIQKDIILILIRSHIPCKLMAGKLFVMSLENFCTTVSSGNDYRELMICLKNIRHAQILDAIFTDVTFMLLFLNMMLLSVIGIQILNNMDQTNEIIRYVFVTSGVLIHLICMCIPGQLLIDQSTEIFNKAYGSTWYTFSIKTRRLLRVLLYRSLTPCTLTAGKMFVMSMAMCSSVLQTAMSYFTAFLSMK